MTKPTLNGNYVSAVPGGTLIRNFKPADREWLLKWTTWFFFSVPEARKHFFIEECNYFYDPATETTRRFYTEGFSLHYVPAKSDPLLHAFIEELDQQTWLRIANRR
jgi:hypothetical protein